MTPAARIAMALFLCAPSASGQQVSGTLPDSTLPLRLVGVMADVSTPKRSAALIQCDRHRERPAARLFAVGERACDVAEVKEVREDGIVIANLATGRTEFVALAKAGVPAGPPADAPGDASVEQDRDTLPAPIVRAGSADTVTVELRKELLQRYESNLPDVLSAALATPRYTTAGSGPPAVEGYEITRIKAGGIVEQLGLRDGDVLLEFNSQKLDSLAAVMGLLGQAQSLSGATMTVLRNGRRLTFVFSVR